MTSLLLYFLTLMICSCKFGHHFLKKDPVTFVEAREAVITLLKDEVVVGHNVGCDLRILDYSHPPADVRNTAFHYRVQHCRELGLKFGPGGLPERNPQEQYKLKDRVCEVLSKDIQGHGLQAHYSIEDAWAACSKHN